jgi:beta-glucanase (GH16 family)
MVTSKAPDTSFPTGPFTHLHGAFVLIAASMFLVPLPSPAAEPHFLDLALYHETFSETFRTSLDVTPFGPSKWIAHTPWHGDFGDAAFTNPEKDFPFVTSADGLKIIARKAADGKWESGLLSSVDPQGRGFTQEGGYFEARMKLPPGPGVWPAFWLAGQGNKTYSTEVDVIEYYGQFPDGYRIALHLWPKSKDLKPEAPGALIQVPSGSLSDTFHTYGVEILSNDIVYYLDRSEVARLPAPPAMHLPLSILVDLGLGSGWPIDKTPNPAILEVDYIKAFKMN